MAQPCRDESVGAPDWNTSEWIASTACEESDAARYSHPTQRMRSILSATLVHKREETNISECKVMSMDGDRRRVDISRDSSVLSTEMYKSELEVC